MSRINNIRSRIRVSRKMNSRRVLIKFAKAASQNAKRTSVALEIPYDIIKDGSIYKVFEGNMIKTASIRKTNIDKTGLTKGSIICLK